jgi:chromosome segregation ATPase
MRAKALLDNALIARRAGTSPAPTNSLCFAQIEQTGGQMEQMTARLLFPLEQMEQTFDRLEHLDVHLEQTRGRLEEMTGQMEEMRGQMEQTGGHLLHLTCHLEQTRGRLEHLNEQKPRLSGRKRHNHHLFNS